MLTSLPDECIMEVLDYLNMADMDEMRVVSRKMNFLEKYQSFRTSRPAELMIVQDFIDYDGYTDYLEGKAPKKAVAITPQSLLETLESLLDLYAVTQLTLVNVRITSSFIPIFEKLTSVIKSLRLSAVATEGGGRNALSALVRSPNLRQLVIQDAPKITRFSPSKNRVVNLLTRFDCFIHRSLAVQPQWLPELFEKILTTNRCGVITVGVTEQPNDLDCEAIPHLKHRKIEGDDGARPMNELINTETGRYLRYRFVNDGDAQLLWISFGYSR